MQNAHRFSHYRATLLGLSFAVAGAALTGCGVTAKDLTVAPTAIAGVALKGSLHGGQQPVSGSSIQLYAASTTGYGAGSLALLQNAVVTDAGGGFNISNNYTCPANSVVYITATGGNPGLAANNPNITMLAALGACSGLSTTSFININELTTVAGVYGLAPFMTSVNAVGTSAANLQGLTQAFGSANKLANIPTGTAIGPAAPAGSVVPVSELNTLADILASCINSAGVTSNTDTTSNCARLFTYSTPAGGAAPTDTVGALLNIAKNPGNNVNNLLTLVSPNAPFQPTLSSASDFTVSIKYKTGIGTGPVAVAVDQSGNLWIPNSTSNSVTVLNASGTPLAGSPYTNAAISGPSAVAIDASGNAWVTNTTSNKLVSITPAGVSTVANSGASSASTFTLSSPQGISIDGSGVLWVTNAGSNSVTAVTVAGTTVSGSTNYTGAGLNSPIGVAINPK